MNSTVFITTLNEGEQFRFAAAGDAPDGIYTFKRECKTWVEFGDECRAGYASKLCIVIKVND